MLSLLPSEADTDVAIVGAGVAGSAAACAFGGQGLSVVVFERRDLGRDPNRGDALHPQSLPFLRKWGALEALESRGALFLRRFQLSDHTGQVNVVVDLAGHPLLVLSHAEIERELLAVAEKRGVCVRSSAVRGAWREGRWWVVATDQGTVRTRLLVGADGERSLIRRVAKIGVNRSEYADPLLILHVSHPEWMARDTGVGVLAPEGGILLVPTTPTARCRVVVLIQRSRLHAWRSANEEELARQLAARAPWLGRLEIISRGDSHLYRLARQHAVRYVDQRLALVGDAAHITHPNGGQGMNLAIQDAGFLGTVAVPALSRPTDDDEVDRALEAYEAVRRPINRRAMNLAHVLAILERPTRPCYLMSRVALLGLSRFPQMLGGVANRFGGGR